MRFATATNSLRGEKARRACPRTPCGSAAFTLAEVLAALLFMAIVIPVAMEALHVASLSGEFAARKVEAAWVADQVLNENIATTNWVQSSLSGATTQNGHDYRWTLRNQTWSEDATMELLSAEVSFSAGGRSGSVALSTLAVPQNAPMGLQQ